ncbi:MAG: asparagine synthase (glutamine-hydrolyzing) [Thermoanaerobaculia bacterium]|nr:asparagine synthase (glutamine-hydrolyzing) [Thermoanaerobaculia bacterium]
MPTLLALVGFSTIPAPDSPFDPFILQADEPMCGICGYTGPERHGLLDRMMDAIVHRGPDSAGRFDSESIHLGNRRLKILDLHDGDQPIFNEDRSLALVYNGEIYNYVTLREELEARGHVFRTETDTEVIVHLYEDEGPACAARLNGMFAFALWDERRNRLVVARDPVGIKPLLYWWNGSELVFGSEAKSLLHHPSVSPKLDRAALHDLLNIRFVPHPRTLFRGIRQLAPGHLLIAEGDGSLRVESYHQWQFPGLAALDLDEAASGFLEHLTAATERQMVADVPLGLYLSGGLDSSSILAAACRSRPASSLKTYTLGFDEPTDENSEAALIAAHFGSDHHEHTLQARPLDLFPRVVYHAEMPKVNATQGYYLSRFARQNVAVALSGLGGDELFYGYELYRYLWPGRFLIDGPLSGAARLVAPVADLLARGLDRLGGLEAENPRRAVELAACGEDPLRYYLTLRNGWDLGAAGAPKIYDSEWQRSLEHSTRDSFEPFFDREDLPFPEQVQWAEFRAKMVDDFLFNEDRMSMANSLEVRVPMLDLEVVRFAFSLPFRIKHRNRQLKPVMKRALEPLLPESILTKRKWGFTFDPYEQYRKDLRDLCLRELTPEFLRQQGIFRAEFVRDVLTHRPTRKLHWHYFMLWQILGLKYWQELFLEGKSWEELEERVAFRHGKAA